MDFKGKNILITGSSRGIGNATMRAFAAQGANIIAHARKKTEEFEQMTASIAKDNQVTVTPVYFDMTDSAAMKEEIKKIFKAKISIDVLVNNAGVAHGGLLQMTTVDEIRHVFECNYFSICELTQLVLRSMKRKKSGVIVNMASISGLELEAGNCAYGASKAALIGLTKTLSKEVALDGIRVNAVAPGLTDTDMATLMEDKAGEAMVRDTAIGRLAKKEEIVNAILFLASEDASFITGQVLRVDGGM